MHTHKGCSLTQPQPTCSHHVFQVTVAHILNTVCWKHVRNPRNIQFGHRSPLSSLACEPLPSFLAFWSLLLCHCLGHSNSLSLQVGELHPLLPLSLFTSCLDSQFFQIFPNTVLWKTTENMIIYDLLWPSRYVFEIAGLQSLIFPSDCQAHWQVNNGCTVEVPLYEWTIELGTMHTVLRQRRGHRRGKLRMKYSNITRSRN